MKTVFIGTPDFAVPSLSKLIDLEIEVSLVVTKPDARRGRGRKLGRSAVKKCALANDLTIYQPEKFSSPPSAGVLERLKPDIGVIVAFGEILAPWLIKMFPRGLYNVHGSLLPKYRGAAPINYALLNGEEETGVTVQRVVPEVDAGPVLARKRTNIDPDENAGQLHDRLAELGGECVGEVAAALARGQEVKETEQDESMVSLAPKLKKEDGKINWERSAEEIRNHIRGLTPWPGAFCKFKGQDREEKITVIEVTPASAETDAEPGTVVEASEENGIIVATGKGTALAVRMLKPAGSRRMNARDFIHGYRVAPGDRFV